MTIYLIPNLTKPQAAATAAAAVEDRCAQGAQVRFPAADAQQPFAGRPVAFLEETSAFSGCDAIVTIGGDGTILHAARRGIGFHKPLLGVNIGRMGFLATVEAYELDKLARLVRGDYLIDERALLQVCVHGANSFRQYALNDVVISKPGLNQTIEVSITCDGIPVNQFMGDGVVVATPTGSTAYALSAGGPVLDARIAGIVMCPVCAHSMHSPPMVFSAQRKLCVHTMGRGSAGALVSCDGWTPEKIAFGDTVEVSLSNRSVSLVSFSEADQFEAIDKKLKGR